MTKKSKPSTPAATPQNAPAKPAAAAALLPADLSFQQAAAGVLPIGDLLTTAGALTAIGRDDQAVLLYQTWLAHTVSPLAYAIHFNLGVVLGNVGDSAGAEAQYRAGIVANPQFIPCYMNLGTQLERQARFEEALAQWDLITKLIKPTTDENRQFVIQALNNQGRLLEIRKQLSAAENKLKLSLTLNPEQPDAITHWVHLRQKQCEWPVYKTFNGIKKADLLKSTSALAMLSASGDPEMQLFAARQFVEKKVAKNLPALSDKAGYQHEKLRIGYLSSDFCSHAVSILTVELLELHDRNRVEVFGFCWSREDGTPMRKRVLAAMDHYVPIGGLTDAAAAEAIRALEIDVLIDLQGLTSGTRPNILAARPAPLQITYLGFPGPTAMPGIDYVLADRFVLPEELAPYFIEKPLYMPNSFQINDRQRAIGVTPTRAACKLPEDAFVFCSFNNNFKFTPDVFATWMRILDRVPDSILWLVADCEEVRVNLNAAAKKAGLADGRLIFAERVQPADYLARYQVADLFLDTIPFNAGTTASDALWAGLPLLTCAGKTFSSRMAGSLLLAVDLPELVTFDLAEYEEKAVSLGHDRARIEAMKKQLVDNRMTCALFDSPRFVRDFEDLLDGLVQTAPSARADGGEAPAARPLVMPEEDVLLVLMAEDIPTALLAAAGLRNYKTVTFDPLLVDTLMESGLANVEFVNPEGAPDFHLLHEDARSTALEIEAALLPAVRHLIPQVDNLSWGNHDLYYFLSVQRWYHFIGHFVVKHFADAKIHLLVNDNPSSFYWPSFVPALTVLEVVNFAGLKFGAYRYGERADETHVVPMLIGENPHKIDVLTHLPTCMHDVEFLNTEIAASGKTVYNVHPKYWGIEIDTPHSCKLVKITELLSAYPDGFRRSVESFHAILLENVNAILKPYISTEAYRERQAAHFANLYRAQFITYFLLNTYFAQHKPGKLLLSNHDSGFHGPLVSFAEQHNIPVLLFPHSKTTPDIQFDGKNITALVHPIQGDPIYDSRQKRVRAVPLAYPEKFSGSSAHPAPLKKIGLLLNAIGLNGVLSSDYPAYVGGVKKIVDWCARKNIELVVRARPGMPMMTLLENDAGLDLVSTERATGIPLARFAEEVDLCLMYDAPTTAELEFLRNNVPILNPIIGQLSKCESMTSNTEVIPQASVEAILFRVEALIDDPLNFQLFRAAQFGAYTNLFRNAESLRSLL